MPLNNRKIIGLVLLIKLPIALFLLIQFQLYYPAERVSGWFIQAGETPTFYQPVEHLAEGNGYSYDYETPVLQPSTRRLPGLVPIYLPMYALMGKGLARNAMVVLQLLLDLLATVMVVKLAHHLFKNTTVSLLVLLLYSINTFVAVYNFIGLAESLGTSLMIIGLYYLVRGLEGPFNGKWLLAAGLLLAWGVFLRPATILLFPVLGLVLLACWLRLEGRALSTLIRSGMLLFLPLVLALGAWNIRNYQVSGKVIFLQDSIYEKFPETYPPQLKAIRHLIGAWGGETPSWEIGSEGEWFFSNTIAPDNHGVFSSRYFTKSFSLDSLLLMREEYHQSVDPDVAPATRAALQDRVIRKADRYREAYRAEKPLHYYVISPLVAVKNFTVQNTVSSLPFPAREQMQFYHLGIKAFYILLYNIMMALGMLGMVMMVPKFKHQGVQLLIAFPVLYIVFIAAIRKGIEPRYLVSIYPWFVLYASYLLGTQAQRISWVQRPVERISGWLNR